MLPVNQVAQTPTAVPPAPAVPSVQPSRVAQTTPPAPAPVTLQVIPDGRFVAISASYLNAEAMERHLRAES
jgi:hypothetical protein